MSWLNRGLNDDVTYWAPGTPDGYGGYAYAAPVKLKGRWEDRQDLFLDDRGEERKAEGVVYVDRDVETEGYLFLGKSSATDPTTVAGAREVRQYRKLRSLTGRTTVRKAWLGT